MRWKSIYSIDLDLRFCQSPIEIGLKIENLSINHNLLFLSKIQNSSSKNRTLSKFIASLIFSSKYFSFLMSSRYSCLIQPQAFGITSVFERKLRTRRVDFDQDILD